MRRRCGSSLNQLARDRHLHRSSVCKVLGRENQRAVKPPWPTEEFMLCYRKNFSANGTGVLPSSNFCHQILPMEDLSELFPLLLVSRQGDRLESDRSGAVSRMARPVASSCSGDSTPSRRDPATPATRRLGPSRPLPTPEIILPANTFSLPCGRCRQGYHFASA